MTAKSITFSIDEFSVPNKIELYALFCNCSSCEIRDNSLARCGAASMEGLPGLAVRSISTVLEVSDMMNAIFIFKCIC